MWKYFSIPTKNTASSGSDEGFQTIDHSDEEWQICADETPKALQNINTMINLIDESHENHSFACETLEILEITNSHFTDCQFINLTNLHLHSTKAHLFIRCSFPELNTLQATGDNVFLNCLFSTKIDLNSTLFENCSHLIVSEESSDQEDEEPTVKLEDQEELVPETEDSVKKETLLDLLTSVPLPVYVVAAFFGLTAVGMMKNN